MLGQGGLLGGSRQLGPDGYQFGVHERGASGDLIKGYYEAFKQANALQKAGMLGIDAAGLLGDIQSMYENPEERTIMNGLLAAAGGLPLIPSGLGTIRKVVDELPMDQASRMQRAEDMGFDKTLYHGTYGDITEFDPDMVDIGTHLGRPAQANNRLDAVYRQREDLPSYGSNQYGENANVMPLMANTGRQLEMPDVGRWDDSAVVSEALRDKPGMSGILDEAWDIKNQYEDVEDWIQSSENRGLLDEINSELQSQGYDSVRYKNMVENEYGDLGVLTAEAQKEKAELNGRIKEIQDRARARKPELPENPTYEQVEEWVKVLDEPDEYLPGELEEIEELRARLMNTNQREDPHSYIVLDPSNIRSVNARFDPAKRDSANILAGGLLGAIGLGGMLGYQGDDATY